MSVPRMRHCKIDIKFGDHHDITNPKVLAKLLSKIRKGTFFAACVAMPCTSFSVARDRTCVIRTKDSPWGLEGKELFSTNDHIALDKGNAIAVATIQVLEALVAAGTPFVLENPHSSRVWSLPEVVNIEERDDTFVLTCDFCQFGTSWRKRTKLLFCHCNPKVAQQALGRSCTGTRGCCSRTCLRHQLLSGKAPGGTCWTLIAQPYPKLFAKGLAHTLIAAVQERLQF